MSRRRPAGMARATTPHPGCDDCSIRRCLENDLEALTPLVRAEVRHAQAIAGYYRLVPRFDWLAYTRGKIVRPKGCVLLVENQAGEAVGFIELRLRRVTEPAAPGGWRRWFGGIKATARLPLAPMRWGWIDACYLDPRYRRRGLGSALVAAAMAWFREIGVDRVELAALAGGDALRFWQQHGFRVFRLGMSRDLGAGAG